jgi:hypothetical protein
LFTSRSTIDRCRNTGFIAVTDDAGGICAAIIEDYLVIKNCSNSGSITGGATAGGIVGISWTGHQIIACYNTGTIATIENAVSSAFAAVGGIAGNLNSVEEDYLAIIIACYNEGDVSSSVGRKDYVPICIGGVVGDNHGYCYGNITASYSIGNLSYTGQEISAGEVYIGGVLGSNGGTVTVSACYWAGTGPTNGISGESPTDTGAVAFSSSAWPVASTHTEWGTGGSGSGQHWKSLGSWNSGTPNYPTLWFEE